MPDPKMQDELQQLQLEEARDAAQVRKGKRMSRESKIKAIEFSLDRDRRQQQYIQAGCAHKKGGKGKDGIYNGNDQNYAVITHTLSHGPTIVVCQRCGKIWEPPARLGRKATQQQRERYVIDMNEYRRALALPTDNEPSGTVLFDIRRDDGEAA